MCSRIDGSHVKLFILKSTTLEDLINNTCAINSALKKITELLMLFPSSCAFWTKVKIGYPGSHDDEIAVYENSIAQF